MSNATFTNEKAAPVPGAVPPAANAAETKSADAVVADAKKAAESALPAGFSGKIRRQVVISDPDAGKDVTFNKGDEALLFAHLTKHREKLLFAYDELVAMRSIHGDWKLQFAK